MAMEHARPAARSQSHVAAKPGVPIPGELWERLRRLDRACPSHSGEGAIEISLVRTMPQNSQWPGYRKVWVVTIRRFAPPYKYDTIQHIRPTLSEALQLAVDEAEGRGWAR